MSEFKCITRLNLSYCAGQIAKKSGNNSWFGVKKVIDNDQRWKTLHRLETISSDLIMSHCNLSGIAVGTINKLEFLVAVIKQTNDNMSKVVKLLTTPKPATQIVMKTRKSLIDVDKFMEIIEANKNAKGNASSTDGFDEYAQKYGTELTSQQRNTFITKELIQTGKCAKSGLKGNNLKVLSSTTTTTTTTTYPSPLNLITTKKKRKNKKRKFVEILVESEPCYKKCTMCTFHNHMALNICEMCGWRL